MRADYDTDVPRDRLQYDANAQRVESLQSGGSRTGSASVLAAGADQLLAGTAVLPLLYVRAHLSTGLSEAAATVPRPVRSGAIRVRTNHAAVRFPVAGPHGLQSFSGPGRINGQSVHGPEQTRISTATSSEASNSQAAKEQQKVQRSKKLRGSPGRGKARKRLHVQLSEGAGAGDEPKRVRGRRRKLCVPVQGDVLHSRRKGVRRRVDHALVGPVRRLDLNDTNHLPNRD